MTVVDELLAGLETDSPVKEVVVGALWTAVVLDSTPPHCGLASSVIVRRHYEHEAPPVPRAGQLLESSARDLAEGLRSSSFLEASIGMATLNSLLEVDEEACEKINAAEVIIERGTGRDVAIVGHFPFVDRVRSKAKNCWVIELEPGDRLFLYTDGLTESLNEDDEELGEERILRVLHSSRRLGIGDNVERLRVQAKAWRGRRPATDDTTVLAFERMREEEKPKKIPELSTADSQ